MKLSATLTRFLAFCAICTTVYQLSAKRNHSNQMMTDMSIEGEAERTVQELESYGHNVDHAAVGDKLKRLYEILPLVAEAGRRNSLISRLQDLGFNFVGEQFKESESEAQAATENLITLIGNATALLDTLEQLRNSGDYDEDYASELVTALYTVLQQMPVSSERDQLLTRAEQTDFPLPEIYLERFSDSTIESTEPAKQEDKAAALEDEALQYLDKAELYKRKAEIAERELELYKQKLELCKQLQESDQEELEEGEAEVEQEEQEEGGQESDQEASQANGSEQEAAEEQEARTEHAE